MVMALAYVAILCLLVAGVRACMDPYDLIHLLQLDTKYVGEAFSALDVDRDDELTLSDMDVHYYHNEGDFAKKKFLEMLDSKYDKGIDVDVKELHTFMMRKPIKLAVYECTYIRAKTLRTYCFKDRILNYVYLVLDQPAITAFFQVMESKNDRDKVICIQDVQRLSGLNHEFGDKDIENFMVEIGMDDMRITKAEFTDYVIQEDIQDDFRPCRQELKGTKARYDSACLTRRLMDFTMNHITELDIASVFQEIDWDENRFVQSYEVVKTTGCDQEVGQRFVALMDKDRDTKVSYGEFRTYIKSHTVKLNLERECTRKTPDIRACILCYKSKLIKLVKDNHNPIWLTLGELDMLFTFEELDFDKDGKISIREDLVRGLKWEDALADKLVREMDGPDEDRDVCLEEFNEYVGDPNMVYAMGDCMELDRGVCRMDCNIKELMDTLKDMMSKEEVEQFFKFYDTDNDEYITKSELEDKGVKGEQLGYFVLEMGMGEDFITKLEFSWFVRQQEINHMFGPCKTVEEKHQALLVYLSDIMTEYDIQTFFMKLDKDHDHEITESDFLAEQHKIKHLLQQMDKNKNNAVNFPEFWIYLNTPMNNVRKKHLEAKCTSQFDDQEEEFNCYKTEIFNLK